MSCRLCPREDITARDLCNAHYQSEKDAGRIHLYPAKQRVRVQRAVDGLCPTEHSHDGTHTCYNAHGCRCTPCRTAKASRRAGYDREDRRRHGRDVWIRATGTMRRLQALAVMGWSTQAIAERIGSHYRPLQKIRGGERRSVRTSTALRVATVFEALCMTYRRGHDGNITIHAARRHGWLPPLAWDDIDRDKQPRMRGAA